MTPKKLIYILQEASVKTHMKYNIEFVKALGERGVDIVLLLEKGTEAEFEKDWREKSSAFFPPNIKTVFLNSKNPIFRIFKMLYFLTKFRFYGYEKVYVHYSFVGAILASISNPKKQVYYWNCGIPWQYKRPFFQELYESFTYKVIDHFVTGAKVLTEKYANFYKFDNKKSIVIPNWIDVDKSRKIIDATDRAGLRKELSFPESDTVLFFNQRLAERKGAHYILPILKATSENVKIIVTNDGPYKEKLLKEIKENNFEDRVRILGRVPNQKVLELLVASDIYILPSEEEGMSHSLMEAFVAARPSVSFDVGGTIDMYPEGTKEFVIPEKDIELFIEKLQFLISDKSLQEKLGTALWNKIREYDKNIVITDFVNKVF